MSQNSPESAVPLEPEPWLRGPLSGVHPMVAPVLHSFMQVREDLATHLAGLTQEQLWLVAGGSSVGFHLKHIAGSVDRLGGYLVGEQITTALLEFLRAESLPGAELPELLSLIECSLARCEERLRQVSPTAFAEPRQVGRRALPTTVIGLIVHLAEHTQRHLGQAIILAKIVRQTS